MEKPGELLNTNKIKQLLKAALPHQADFIDQHDHGAYHYLLDEIENSLLAELRRILEGREADHASIKQSGEIMELIKQLDKERVEKAAETANAEFASQE